MSKSNTFENDLLLLIFNNDDIANIGDAGGIGGSTSDGNLYVSLHTADPGEAGDQATNETAYTNYLRVAVARTVGGWTVSGNTASNAALVQFATCGASGATITHFGVGAASSAAGKLLYSGALTSPLAVSSGIQPQFATGELDVTED
jgi:hypothetical protein